MSRLICHALVNLCNEYFRQYDTVCIPVYSWHLWPSWFSSVSVSAVLGTLLDPRENLPVPPAMCHTVCAAAPLLAQSHLNIDKMIN